MLRFFYLFSTCRCGIALDCWMLPIHHDLCASGVQQPLLFINSKHHVLYRVKNLESMMKMEKPPDETGFSKCQILTLKYVTLPKLLVYSHAFLYVKYRHANLIHLTNIIVDTFYTSMTTFIKSKAPPLI